MGVSTSSIEPAFPPDVHNAECDMYWTYLEEVSIEPAFPPDVHLLFTFVVNSLL